MENKVKNEIADLTSVMKVVLDYRETKKETYSFCFQYTNAIFLRQRYSYIFFSQLSYNFFSLAEKGECERETGTP